MYREKKILILDSLTETFDGTVVKSGLQKSSKLDARSFSKFYDTTFAYCGKLVDKYKYKHFIVDELGTKDRAIKETNNHKRSRFYVRKYLGKLHQHTNKFDLIIAHCHSITMINGLNDLCKDRDILFIIHDVVDLLWANGLTKSVINLRNNKRNNVKILTNSNYSIERLQALYERRKNVEILNDAIDGYIKHFVWTDQKPTVDQIKEKVNETCIIGRYEPNKYHHKLFKYKNDNNTIVHYGIKDSRRDSELKYYNRIKKESNCYRENLSDKDLFKHVSKSKTVVLPCYHEGFGYTAFEAGIFGVYSIVLAKKLTNGKYLHATSEYLTRANVPHKMCNFIDNNDIYESIDKSLEIDLNTRLLISNNLLNYFNVEDYVKERIEWVNKKPIEYKTKKQLTIF